MSSPPPDVRQNSSSPQNIFWDCSTAQNLQQGLHMKRKGQLFCKTVKGSILSIQHRPQPAEQSCLALTGVGAPESCDSQHQPSPAQGSASLAPARDRESSHLLHTQQEFLHTDPHWQNRGIKAQRAFQCCTQAFSLQPCSLPAEMFHSTPEPCCGGCLDIIPRGLSGWKSRRNHRTVPQAVKVCPNLQGGCCSTLLPTEVTVCLLPREGLFCCITAMRCEGCIFWESCDTARRTHGSLDFVEMSEDMGHSANEVSLQLVFFLPSTMLRYQHCTALLTPTGAPWMPSGAQRAPPLHRPSSTTGTSQWYIQYTYQCSTQSTPQTVWGLREFQLTLWRILSLEMLPLKLY